MLLQFVISFFRAVLAGCQPVPTPQPGEKSYVSYSVKSKTFDKPSDQVQCLDVIYSPNVDYCGTQQIQVWATVAELSNQRKAVPVIALFIEKLGYDPIEGKNTDSIVPPTLPYGEHLNGVALTGCVVVHAPNVPVTLSIRIINW